MFICSSAYAVIRGMVLRPGDSKARKFHLSFLCISVMYKMVVLVPEFPVLVVNHAPSSKLIDLIGVFIISIY